MKRFLVKCHSVATPANKNFAGQENTTYYGKDQKLLASLGSHAEAVYMAFDNRSWQTKEYGYTRKCDAVRSYIYKNPENTEYWQTEVEIVEVEV